jgi:hypothetical protein
MTSNPATSPPKDPIRVYILLAILAAVYLLNFVTPLRLTADGLRYFRMEEWMEGGFASSSQAARDYLPYGYGLVLWLLAKLHLYHTFTLVCLNALYLTGALWFVLKIMDLVPRPGYMLILVLLNWLTIKFVLTPLSEMQYLFFSSGTLYFFQQYLTGSRLKTLGLGLLFFAAAVVTRTVAMVLLAALIVTILSNQRRQLGNYLSSHWFGAGGLILLTLCVVYFSHALRIQDYLHQLARPFEISGLPGLWSTLTRHPKDWAEVFINAPISKIGFISNGLVNVIFLIAGLSTLGWTLYLFIRGNTGIPLLVRNYVLLYIIVIYNWPFFESRFWLPILPLLAAAIVKAPRPKHSLARAILTAAKWFYLLAGIYALSYYSYTSWNKRIFAVKQSAGVLQNEYETHFFGRPLQDSSHRNNEEVLHFLKRID